MVTQSTKRYETAPEDRIPFGQKIIYGTGAFVNNILAAAIGGMVIVLNLGLGMDPALVGLLGALPRLTDALTDPLMGYISDNTRSPWGRRRPYIFVGAIAVGIIFALMWQLPRGYSDMFYFWLFLAASILFYLAYTMFATPWVALGFELTPDFHERTRLMGVQNFIGQLAYVVSPWFLWFMTLEMFEDELSGASTLAIIIAVFVIAVGVLPAIFLRERITQTPANEDSDEEQMNFWDRIVDFFKGFAKTLTSGPFLRLCIATFLVFNGFMLISSFQFYVIIYYVFGGDKAAGAEYAGYAGSIGAVSTFIVIGIVTYLATAIGKRRAFFVATGLSIVGYALKWVCYNPEYPVLVLLPAPLLAFGLGGLFTLMPSMIADVVDYDELETNQRREGMYGSIFWWVVKVGMAAALAAGGFLLNLTGFDVALEGNQSADTLYWMRVADVVVPIIASFIAIFAIMSYPLTEQRAHEIRDELERRRGSLGPADDEPNATA
ncbi:MAG: MFS transporter [Myxococcota bacterium]